MDIKIIFICSILFSFFVLPKDLSLKLIASILIRDSMARGCHLAALWHLYSYLVRLLSYSPPRTVFVIESATISASPALAIAACDPPLKAKKPKNRMNPPKAACCEGATDDQ